MEKRKKDQTLACSATQEPETSGLLTNEDQGQPNVSLVTKTNRTGSPSDGNAFSLNQQHPPVVQWPYTAQHAVEQPPLISKPCIPTQSLSPIILNQWQQLSHLQQNPAGHQDQLGQPPHFVQPTVPFWLPQRPVYPFPGVNAAPTIQPFAPLGTTDSGWQAPGALGGGTSSKNQPQIPNFCYQVGYTHPGFPGPWDHSSWWGQAQQSQSPSTYAFPGACGFFSLQPPPMPSCAASLGQQFFQRGIIRPPAKLSQKHQQLWDAQSAENVQLWNVINLLQSEIADYKNRLMKLEAEVSSLKPTVEEANAQVIAFGSAGKPSKRGRSKRPSVNTLTSPSESHPRARGRKHPPAQAQSESKTLIFEKVILNKVEDKQKASHSTATMEQENIEEISNILTPHSSGNMEINGNNLMMPVYHNQVHQQFTGVQIGGFGLNSSSELNSIDEKVKKLKTGYSILSQQAKGMNNKGASTINMGATVNGSLGWHPNITSEDCGRNLINMGSQGFYNDGNIIRQEGKIIPGWGYVNEEDASEELEDAVVGSAKDEKEEEMEDDASSGAEEIAQKQDEGGYKMDGAVGISPKGLPPHSNW
ncbi:uncharacterized protein LOC132172054 [Corylus avellana]|uniref:uncharacterized protein LOC132172054 n=1 Tax=Corylus avellana TaxID=13451 RepID=UPI001E20A1FB|nr:uncharacterized protein LOC132172054 [Corylus avellana]